MDSEVESLLSQACFFGTKSEEQGERRYIDKAIVVDRQALDICGRSHSWRSACLTQLSFHLTTRYKSLGKIDDLNVAILLGREALELCPPGNADRSMSLNNLAADLSTRYNQLLNIEDLNEAILLSREALALCPPGDPERSTTLNNLAADLSTRHNQLGRVEDLNEAIILDREALTFSSPSDPDRSMTLNNLAVHLSTRHSQLAGAEDLNEAILLDKEALALRPPGHPDRSESLNNLAAGLSIRYKHLGGMEDANEAILLNREALILRPLGDPDRSESLNNLAINLSVRYSRLGGVDDLNEAILLDREALTSRPLGHPDRPQSLNNLAVRLSTRHELLGDVRDLNEAIMLDKEGLALRPPGHPDRSQSLNNLAGDLTTRFNHLGKMGDLNEAIFLNKQALELRPPEHPGRSQPLNNLAVSFSTRHSRLGGLEDLNEAIILYGEALVVCPPGHPNWSTLLIGLATDLCTRHKLLGKPEDRDEVFGLYVQLAHVTEIASSEDLSAAKAWVSTAEDFSHPTTILAYQVALGFLVQHIAALPSLPQHLTVLKSFTSTLAADAFSACLRNNSPEDAVQLLEQGRCVFWAQLTRLCSPLDDVVSSGPGGKILADQFTGLTTLIRNALDLPGPDQHDRICCLNAELKTLVSNIRKLPGLSRFLLPSLFSHLRRAASCGPVIIVNASQYGCDTLILFADKDPVHIPLSITKNEIQQLSSRLRSLTALAKRSFVTRELSIFLRELWDLIVSPIVDFLLTACPRRSRIWWCPTAEFSLLPLHAAAPYRSGQLGLANLYISSYTPTLSALIRAREHHLLGAAVGPKRMAAIGQAKATGESELLSVGKELATIGRRVNGAATFTRIQDKDACISRVTEEIGKNEWVHLACHGIPNKKHPFESAFALYDGRLTVQRIIQCELRNPEFAYLSACHTMVGDEESPDEAIHLASAMQFVGFRSVIGTMWAVDDEQAAKITSVFYKHVVDDESGRLDHTRAAFALRETMKTVDVPLDQRILYVHIGA